MEALANIQKLRHNATLTPISRSLSDEEVLELYHSGRAIYVEQDEEEEVYKLIQKAVNRTLKCRNMIAKGKSDEDVRAHYMKLFGGVYRSEAMARMKDAKKRKQFICENVGILMERGVLYGKNRDIAKMLEYTSLSTESAMRYIRLGREIAKK